MVTADFILPPTPERTFPLRGLALAVLLHAGIAAGILLLSQRTLPEIPIFEVAFTLPDPAPVPIAAEASPPVPPAAEPEPPPAPEPQTAAIAAEPVPVAAPRPLSKPRRPDPVPAATSPSQSSQLSIDQMLAALPPAPAPLPAAPAAIPAPQPAAPAIPPMQLYAARLRNLLAEYQEYPRAARQRRQEGVVRIALTIDRTGQLTALRLYEGGTASALDDAALAMARRAAPFPPPPLEPQQMQAVFVVPVRFALEE